MKAAVLYGKKDLWIEERDEPAIRNPDEVLIKIQSVGICASDRMYYFSGGTLRGIPKPFVLGHECSGIIVDKGKKVRSLQIGDRVAIEPGLPCNHCEFCLSGNYNLCKSMKFMASHSFDGCLVEYLIWREDRVFKIPENMTFDEAALIEPLSVAIFAVRSSKISKNTRVLISGAGPIGILAAEVSSLYKAKEIYIADIIDNRLKTAAKVCSAKTINFDNPTIEEELEEIKESNPVDVIIETTGSPQALENGLKVLKRGGQLSLIGLSVKSLPLRIIDIVYQAYKIQGIYRFANTYPQAIGWVSSGAVNVKGLISHRFPFDDLKTALEVSQERDKALKVIINF